MQEALASMEISPEAAALAATMDDSAVAKRTLLLRTAFRTISVAMREWLRRHRQKVLNDQLRPTVTMRTATSCSTSTPVNAKAELARQARVDGHGWRVPLHTTYLPLGTPRLRVERKPDWTIAEAEAGRLARSRARTRVPPIALGVGKSITSSVPKHGRAHYQTTLHDAKAILCLNVEVISGDPDLYVVREDGSGITHPSPANCRWSSSGSGSDTVEIGPTDPHFGVGTYYFSVYDGGGGGETTSFHVSVSTRRQPKPLLVYVNSAHGKELRAEKRSSDWRRRRVSVGAAPIPLISQRAALLTDTPAHRLAAMTRMPRVSENVLAPTGVALRLRQLLSARLDMALAALRGAPTRQALRGQHLTSEWLCDVLAHACASLPLAASEPLARIGEVCIFIQRNRLAWPHRR